MKLTAFLALSSLYGMGFAASVLGAFKLELAKSLRVDNARIGGLVTTSTLTSMVTSLLIGVLIDMTGYYSAALIGFLFTSLSFFLLVSARRFSTAVLACLFLGMGGMSLNAFGSTLVTAVLFGGDNPSRALTIGHMIASFGGMTLPLTLGLLLARLGYRRIGYSIALILLVPLPFVLAAHFPAVSSDFNRYHAIGLLSNPVVLAACAALYFYVGIEASFCTWITSYIASLDIGKRAAQYALALFWLSLLLGRLGASKFITPSTEMPLIIILAIAAALTITVMIYNKHGRTGFVTTVISGLVLGPVFPIIVGRIFNVVDESLRGSVYGILIAAALLGAATIPAGVGIVSVGRPFRKSLAVLFGAALAMLCCIVVVYWLTV